MVAYNQKSAMVVFHIIVTLTSNELNNNSGFYALLIIYYLWVPDWSRHSFSHSIMQALFAVALYDLNLFHLNFPVNGVHVILTIPLLFVCWQNIFSYFFHVDKSANEHKSASLKAIIKSGNVLI